MNIVRGAALVMCACVMAGPVSAGAVRVTKPVYFEGFDAPGIAEDLGRFATRLLELRLEPEKGIALVRGRDQACNSEQDVQQLSTTPSGAIDTGRVRHFVVHGSLSRTDRQEYSLEYAVRQVDDCRRTPKDLLSDARRFMSSDALAVLNVVADEIAIVLADAASDKLPIRITAGDFTLQTRLELAFGDSDTFRVVSGKAESDYAVTVSRNGSSSLQVAIAGPDSAADLATVPLGSKKPATAGVEIDAARTIVRRAEDMEARRRVGVIGPLDRFKPSELVEKARAACGAEPQCSAEPRAVVALLAGRSDLPSEGDELLARAWQSLGNAVNAAQAYERALSRADASKRRELTVAAADAWESAGIGSRAHVHWREAAAAERAAGALTTATAIHVSHTAVDTREAWSALLEASGGDGERAVSTEWERLLQAEDLRVADIDAACAEAQKRERLGLGGICRRDLALHDNANGDRAAAVKAYEQSLSTLRMATGWTQDFRARYAYEYAYVLDWNTRRPEAIAAARESLDLRTTLLGQEHETTSDSLDQLGRLYSWDHRYTDAREALERALTIRLRSDSRLLERGRTERTLAWVYAQSGDYAKSAALFTTSFATLDRAGARSDLSGAMYDHATVLHDIGKFSESIQQYRKALEIVSDRDPDGAAAVRILSSLTIALADAGNFTEAISTGTRVVDIHEKTADDFEGQSIGHNNLAIAFYYSGQYARAKREFDRALELILKAPPEPTRGENQWYNVGLLAEALGRFAESENGYRTALEMVSRVYGKDSSEAAYDELRLANVLTTIGRYREAERDIAHSAPIIEKQYPAESVRPTVAQGIQSDLLFARGDVDAAASLAGRALAIRDSQKSESEWRLTVYLLRVGRMLIAQHRESDAAAAFNRVIDIWTRAGVPTHPDAFTAEWGLGVVAGAAGQFEEMTSHCRRALDGSRRTEAPLPLLESSAHACLADAAAHMNNIAQAVTEQRRAFDVFVAACPRPHPDAARLSDRLAELLELQGNQAAAAESRARAKDLRDRHAALEGSVN